MAWRRVARLSKSRRGKAGQGAARRGMAGLGAARRGKARQGTYLTGGVMSIKETRPETTIIHGRLLQAKPGDMIRYSELSALCGLDVQKHRHLLYTAKRNAERELRCLFSVVTDVGLILNPPDANVDEVKRDSARVRRKARRSINRSANVPYESMSPQAKLELTAERTLLKLACMTYSRKTRRLVTSVVSGTTEYLESTKVLFGKIRLSPPSPPRLGVSK